jgi:hypothetical protein
LVAGARTVVWDEAFQRQVDRLQPDAERLDEQLRAVEWVVATRPERCPIMINTRLRLVLTDPFPGAPSLRVFFTIDDEHACTLRWVELAEPEE